MRTDPAGQKKIKHGMIAICLACLPACSFFKSKKSAPEAEPSKPPVESTQAAETAPVATIAPEAAAEPSKPMMPDDGLRLPDMLTMPEDKELKAAPSTPSEKPSEPSPVIARPPTDLPPKPQAEEPTPE
ncbi:MAG: hypothetical protein ACO3F7_05415 [Luteolibacter sp.]